MRKLIKVLKTIGISLLSMVLLSLAFIGIYSQIGNSKIEAEIDGLGTKLVAISYWKLDRSDRHWKLAYSINDKININLDVEATSKAWLQILEPRRTFRSKKIVLYIDPNDEIVLQGKNDSISIDYDVIRGNNLCCQIAELRKEFLPYYKEESRLWYLSKQLRKTDWEKSKRLTEQFDSLRFYTVAPLRTEWAKQHLDYELTPSYLLESHVAKDTVIKYHGLLTEKAKNSYYGKTLSGIISGWENSKIGNLAPDFSQITLNGTTFSLRELRGKYVVLDFWGTWCGPCMYGMPKMKKYYNKYKSQIEFVGIACNDKESTWKKTVEKNEMDWIQLLNDNSSTNLEVLYGVQSYPTKIIINPKGEVINKFEGEVDVFYHEIDSLMNKQSIANNM
uniref:TlpA family protein disulfide reductase n=1 Tax=uncultured Draconibacterium sp. TaxID=1573823 RepID=UPI0032180581